MKTLAPEMNSRIFKSLYGGVESGALYVVNEYPGMAYLEKARKKFNEAREYNKGVRPLGKTGRRFIASSPLVEATPSTGELN